LFTDPHLLEGRQGGEDGTTNPDRVFPFWWGDDLDFHGGWGQVTDFLLHPIGDSWVHGGTSRQDGVGVQVFSDIDVALHDGVVGGFVNTGGFHTEEAWLEQGFWASESLVSDGDDLTVWEFVGFLQGTGTGGSVHFLFKVQSDVAELFFDVSHDFSFGGGGETVTSFGQDFHQVVGQISTG